MRLLLTTAVKINLLSANLWSTLTAVSSVALSFLTAGLAVKLLPPADAGLVLFAVSFVSMVEAVGGLGIREAALRSLSALFIRNEYDQANVVFATSFFLVAILYGVVFIVGQLLGPWLATMLSYSDPQTGSLYLSLMLFVLLIQQLASMLTMTFQASHLYKIGSLHSIVMNGITSVGAFLTLTLSHSMIALGIFRSVTLVLFLVYLLLDVFKLRPCRLVGTFSISITLEMIRYGRSIVGTKLLALGVNGLDRIFFVSAFGLVALPLYALPRRMFEMTHRLFCQQSAYLFPVMSSGGPLVSFRCFSKVRWEYSMLAAFVYTGIAALGPLLLSFLVDVEFAVSAEPFVFLFCIVGFIQSYELVLMPYALATGRPNVSFWAKLAASGCVVIPMCLFSRYEPNIVLFSLAQLGVCASPMVLVFGLFGVRRARGMLLDMLVSPCGAFFISMCLMFCFCASFELVAAAIYKLLVVLSLLAFFVVYELLFIRRDSAVLRMEQLRSWLGARFNGGRQAI